MPGLRLSLFGTPRAYADGTDVALNLRPRTLPLLAFFLLSPQRTADVRVVASQFWPDELDEDALANVRRHLYYARHWLTAAGADPDGIERKGRSVTIAPRAIEWTDVLEFERLALEGDYSAAMDLYSGDFMAGSSEDWIVARRDELREAFVQIAEKAVEESLNVPARAAALAQRVLAVDPFRESAVRGLMRALDASGDRAGALREYKRFVRALREEVVAEPSDATVQLAATLSASVAPAKYGIPRSINSFVGREPARRELIGMCVDSRLVTITGTAGVGKTRLAAEVARDMESGFADGARFIDLSSLTDERAIATALQLALVPNDESVIAGDERTMEAAIREHAYLIVLDNCEHLVELIAHFVRRLLQASAQSHVLCTSRVPLHVPGEVTWRLDPLEVATEAVQLFTDRARAARPSINPSRFSSVDVQRICGHVDGLPLAIEIAAARLRTMTLREVADQLARRMGAMAQALRWSVDLLSQSERRIFYRLSIFQDGFTVESATAVCESDVGDVISSLADNSLVVPPEPDAQYPRYRMLESIRQPAFKALIESGDGDAAQELHANHFAEQFIALEEDLRHARSSLYFDLLEREYQNVRAALDWLIGRKKDVETGMRLTLALSRYWFDRGMIAEARAWMERALACEADPLLAARVFQCLATVSRNCGDYAESYRLVEASVERLKAGGADAGTLGKAAAVQSNAARILGDFETARRLGREAMALFAPSGDAYLIAFAHTCIAVTLYGEGRLQEAEREFEHILDEFEKCGAENDSALTMTNLGICRLYAGDYDIARARFNAALPRAMALQHRYCEAWTRLGLTMTYALTEDYEHAAEELARSVRLARTIEDKEIQIGCAESAALCCARQTPERAAHFLGCASRARERYHVQRLPVETPLYETLLEILSTALSASALQIALEEGRFTSLETSLKELEASELVTQPA